MLGFSHSQAQKARYSAEGHYKQWLKDIVANDGAAPTTLNDYYAAKNSDADDYVILVRYSRDIKAGWVSPLAGLENYQKTERQRRYWSAGQKAE
ncbi:hypothetical protein HCH52_00745 [Oscillospiraceae bacterium HV4-5-C5C]|nr:hypothetical protein [Oscillospiraceae bacterium HV4-5-C5C]